MPISRMSAFSAIGPRLGGDLPAGAGGAVQPEDGPALRGAELGEPDLAVLADGDVSFELRAIDCDNHAQSVACRP